MGPSGRVDGHAFAWASCSFAGQSGYRDYFDDDQVAQIEGCIRDRLDRVFGYGDVAAGRRNQA